MANPLKRFGVWVTDLRGNLFVWARIKLSALYLLIVAVIFIIYSVAIYTNVSDRAWDNPPTIRNLGEQTIYDQAVDGTRSLIFLVDGVVFVISAGLSYLLAGYTLRPIKEALTAQTAFSADASHELRTPLAVMRTGIEVLLRRKEPLSKEAQKVLRSNLEEIQSMSRMAEQLLALSRGQEPAERSFEIVEMGIVVGAIIEKFSHIASEKSIKLTTGTLERVRVRGDVWELERMLQNIIANAIAYTQKGGSVDVSLFNENNMALISVVDTGIGIAEKDIPHLFERFYKADSARMDRGSGSGLGLSIVKQIVDSYKGTITIESTVGNGTKVLVKIPAVISS